ncbi:ferrochelatase [Granulicella cerasi]|uniref:Ferrochelatase n=1 Tax=Granulicella cerasi TaxID=741063 RepID=A0ABW1Z8F3_9BACT|nr:ferrochelatase [Granulicella cerasi]
MSHAILLLAHGTPDTLDQMAEYLAHVTNGRPMPQHVVEELQHRYGEIGLRHEPLPEGPPLTRLTLLQGKLLEQELGTRVYVGMRNWHPFIGEVVEQMKSDGVTSATVLCLAPQNSRTSTGLYRRALEKALDNAFPFTFIAGWADEPLLIEAFADKLTTAWQAACTKHNARVPVLFTAHSVPCRTIRATTEQQAAEGSNRPGENTPADGLQNYGAAEAGDPYPIECKQTAALVAARAGLSEADWFFAFQSQGVAGAPWIGPSVEDTITALAAAGHRAVVMQPIGFLCDHVEILYDIDVNFRDFGNERGISVTRAESLNDSPKLIDGIAHVLATRA